jgi:hypothetical protein
LRGRGGESGRFERWVEGLVGFRDIDGFRSFGTLRCWLGCSRFKGIAGALLRDGAAGWFSSDLGERNIVFILGFWCFGSRPDALFFEFQKPSIWVRLEPKNTPDIIRFPPLVFQLDDKSLGSVLGFAGFSLVLLRRMSNFRDDCFPSNTGSVRLSRFFITGFSSAESMFLGLFSGFLL